MWQEPYSYILAGRSQRPGLLGCCLSLGQSRPRLETCTRCNGRFAARRPTRIFGADRLQRDTLRLATNCRNDRVDDSRRVSREALCFGRLTNRSDADDHVSTIRPQMSARSDKAINPPLDFRLFFPAMRHRMLLTCAGETVILLAAKRRPRPWPSFGVLVKLLADLR